MHMQMDTRDRRDATYKPKTRERTALAKVQTRMRWHGARMRWRVRPPIKSNEPRYNRQG